MLGFICALSIEVEGIVGMMENKSEQTVAKITYHQGEIGGKKVVCCECGIGKVNAAMSTQLMIDLYHPDVIINSGIAGSLSGDIRIGDIVVSDDCVQHDMDGTEMGDAKEDPEWTKIANHMGIPYYGKDHFLNVDKQQELLNSSKAMTNHANQPHQPPLRPMGHHSARCCTTTVRQRR